MRQARRAKPARPREAALRLLARRDYSRAELAQRLVRRGVPSAEVETLLDEFEQLGYLSDARYAGALVRQREGRLAPRAIARDLRDKGIGADAARDALSSLDARDELADATTLWTRRFGTAPADDREKARQVRFLLSRGYSAAIAFRVLRAAGATLDES